MEFGIRNIACHAAQGWVLDAPVQARAVAHARFGRAANRVSPIGIGRASLVMSGDAAGPVVMADGGVNRASQTEHGNVGRGCGERLLAALAPVAVPAADVDVGGELVRVILSLVAVVALIFVAGWLSRRMQGRARAGGRRLRCVESMAVGARDRLLLIDADGKRLLVGAGPGGLRTLHVYDGAAPVDEMPPPVLPGVPNFAQLVARLRKPRP